MQVADTFSTVLITGESGTGKELVAKAIHFNSSRKDRPFVTVHCGALPEMLLESELFGHMKGSFSGAFTSKQGLFEVANEGTIFLDQISATTSALQIKLLRVLQDREFMRVGGTTTLKMDVRVIAASNKDLLEEVSKGTFREDLYYRLNVLPIVIPPLRDRKDDIPLLVDFFLGKECQGRERKNITLKALKCLMSHRWQGNVRELENIVELLKILVPGNTILPEHIPDTIRNIRTS